MDVATKTAARPRHKSDRIISLNPGQAQVVNVARNGVAWKQAALSIGVILAALLAGAGIGAKLMQQRQKSKMVAISVNGVTISDDDIFRRMQAAAGPRALQQLVADEIFLQYAKENGLALPDAQIDAEAAKVWQKPGLRQLWKADGVSGDDVRRQLRVNMTRASILTKGITATDAEARRFYEFNTDSRNPNAYFFTPEIAQVAVVITDSKDQADKALLDLNHGVPFATVVKTYSTDVSKANNGLLPPVQRGRNKDPRVASLEKTIFSLKIGETSSIASFAKTWWVIRCLDKRAAATIPLQDVRAECEVAASLRKTPVESANRLDDEVRAFQKKAKVEFVWPQYREAAKAMQEGLTAP